MTRKKATSDDWTRQMAPAWPEATLFQRMVDCLAQLTVFGLVTDREAGPIRRRIAKELRRQRATMLMEEDCDE